MAEPNPRALVDRQEITTQIYRYCRAMDRIDRELGYAVWHPDGTADYGAHIFQGLGRNFIDHVCAQHTKLLHHAHQVTNILIDLNSEKAASESYVTANLRMQRDGKLLQICTIGRYLDRWSRRAGIWAIDHRVTVIDMDEIREVTPISLRSGARRDRDDPSYSILEAEK